MTGIARWFLVSALVYGVIGMMLGVHMAASEDHVQMPTHAHIMVVGWLSFAMFAVIYHVCAQASGKLGLIHFWLAQASLLAMSIALFGLLNGNEQLQPLAAGASVAYLLSFLVFCAAMMPVVTSRPDNTGHPK